MIKEIKTDKNRSHNSTKKKPKTLLSVAAFHCKLNESMKLLESERSCTSIGKNLLIIGSEIW